MYKCLHWRKIYADRFENEKKKIYITVIWNSCNTLLKNHAISYEIQHVALAFKAAFNCIKHNLHQQDSFFFINVNICNIFYDTCPDYMKENFFRLSNLHRYNTRGSNFNFHVPRIKTHSSGSFFFIMPLLIGIGCLMISSQSLWNLFLKEVLKLTF